ncbi:MAG: DUF3822 family protein [Sphingobacteriales bacterium]|nr:DUF3822 family protein [Sphingobacteriales bacterium]
MNDKLHLSVPDFEPANAKDYELCIEIGTNYHHFAVISPAEKAVKVVSSKASVIFNELENSLLRTHFAQSKISLPTQKFTFIPTELFDPKNSSVYSKYLQTDEHDEVFFSYMNGGEITIVYAFSKLILDKIGKHFPDAKVYPQFQAFFEGIDYGFAQIDAPQLFVNFKNAYLEIIVYKNKSFQFYNCFDFQNDDEVIYYLLLAMQQNGLKPNSTTVKVSGNISGKTDTYQKIATQFPRTEVTDHDSLPLNYAGLGMAVMPRFFSLFSLHLCE